MQRPAGRRETGGSYVHDGSIEVQGTGVLVSLRKVDRRQRSLETRREGKGSVRLPPRSVDVPRPGSRPPCVSQSRRKYTDWSTRPTPYSSLLCLLFGTKRRRCLPEGRDSESGPRSCRKVSREDRFLVEASVRLGPCKIRRTPERGRCGDKGRRKVGPTGGVATTFGQGRSLVVGNLGTPWL